LAGDERIAKTEKARDRADIGTDPVAESKRSRG
jgi:hypothetical protein